MQQTCSTPLIVAPSVRTEGAAIFARARATCDIPEQRVPAASVLHKISSDLHHKMSDLDECGMGCGNTPAEATLSAAETLLTVRGRAADQASANQALVAEFAERVIAERTFRSLLDWVPVGVYRTSPEGEILGVSSAFVQMLRYPDAASLTILNARDLYEDSTEAARWHDQMQRDGSVNALEVRLRRFDGQPLWVSTSARAVPTGPGGGRYYEGIINEITLHKMAESALSRQNDNLEQQAKTMAQAVHDGAGQLLTLAHIALAEAGRDLGPSARERLKEVQDHLDGIEQQLRHLAHELRPRILDDLGLVPALEFLAEGVGRRWRLSVTIDTTLQRRLPQVLETTLYRLVQEALTNVGKHARALQVTVRLEQMPRTLRCSIRDDGIGFDITAVLARLGEQGLGLLGIRDRVEALGGMLQANSAPGRGTELVITIPMETFQCGCESSWRTTTRSFAKVSGSS